MVSEDTTASIHTATMSTKDPTDRYIHLDDHGKFENLSKKTLENLQKKFLEVFWSQRSLSTEAI